MENFKEAMMEFMKILNKRLEQQRRLTKNATKNKTNGWKKTFQLLVSKKEQGSRYSFPQDSVIYSVAEFKYNPEEGVIFEAYFHRYEEVFQKGCATWSDEKKIHLLLGKFGQR